MSQTLSLLPGKYSLFITPPVAGVDFTGTPTPSVSYQWRKNGAAIAGQTAATITGVGVEQSGGTVDLVDGDTISIDIILTNPVQVTTKTVSAVIDASIPAPAISPISIRLASAPNDAVSTIPNASIGSQILVASAGSVNVVTKPPLLPSYQWRRGFAPIAGATLQTYTLQAADADSIIDCVVTATNVGGTTTRTATATVGTLPAASWTEPTPSADSRIVYIASESSGGNDVAAAAVKGRGYYLPSDPEIGADPTQPVGAVVAYRNPQEALRRLRGSGLNNANGGAPEWVLFRRGDTFPKSILDGNYCYWGGAPPSFNIGGIWGWAWTNSGQAAVACTGSYGPSFSYEGGRYRGRSESERFVISAWGSPSDARPVFPERFGVEATMWNAVVSSLDLQGGIGFASASQSYRNTLVEDCRVAVGSGGFHISGGDSSTSLVLRRCVFTGGFSPSGHNSAPYVGLAGGASLIFEECIFDHNGFKENPFDPSTWTSGAVSTLTPGQLPVGEGVQPTRTYFDRNIYIGTGGTGEGNKYVKFVMRGNIISRGGGGGSVQMRQGGISERNVFMWNEDVGYINSGEGADIGSTGKAGGLFVNNLVLHDDHMLPPGGWGMGVKVFNSENWNNEGYGWSLDPDPRYIVDDSVFAHFHRGTNGNGMLGILNASTTNGSSLGTVLNGRVSVTDNVFHRSQSVGMLLSGYGTWDDAVIGGNQIAIASGTLFNSGAVHLTSVAAKGSIPYSIGDVNSGGNLYWSQSATPFGGNRTFAQWQALRSGFESESQFHSDFAAFKSAAGWTTPERDIVSYMQSIDPTYIPNEDVTTDDGVPVENRRPNARLVREVLRDSSVGGYIDSFWGDSEGMTEARARLIARRYHAFITFIERAKANRKGAWDPAYTADALNNYIRDGFGKPAVTGAYDTRSLTDRFLDYLT